MEIYHNNKLVVKDNVVIQPDLIPISSIGNLEQYTHQGTLIFYSTKENVDKQGLIKRVLKQRHSIMTKWKQEFQQWKIMALL